MNRAQQVQMVLIENPLMTSSDVGRMLNISSNAVRSGVQATWGISFGDLRREVFEGHWQRINQEPQS
ncbi:hypothetical protein ACFFUB_02480 [Algimonas porphyrae]|uniref:Uncharacterized protein n=1 Tax=Algimonas porphyrae TaxID=1128113 RepID=A0ABQ5V154_9PROT|nr:hypothetical protein [Algimonas porphyrae]GLQ20375.1 hypothetical protein GCM10007854_13300 [Algimonas porphyrae]